MNNDGLTPYKKAYQQYREYVEKPAILYGDYFLSLGDPMDAARFFCLFALANEFDILQRPAHYREVITQAELSLEDKELAFTHIDILLWAAPLEDTPDNRTEAKRRWSELDTPDFKWTAPFFEGFNFLLNDDDLRVLLKAMGEGEEAADKIYQLALKEVLERHEP